MPKIDVYNMEGQVSGEILLSDKVFAAEINEPVLHTVVKAYLANQRQGTQSALTRGEVSGGGKKPWRQKGTGRARHGSIRSPQWTHGGVVFAPKPRSYRVSVNKKVKRIAMLSALSAKFAANEMKVVDNISLTDYSTKSIVAMLKALNIEGKALIVLPESDRVVVKSAANIPGVKTAPANSLNVYDILNHTTCVFARSAIEKIEEVYA